MNNRRLIIKFAAVGALLFASGVRSEFWPFSRDKNSKEDTGDIVEIDWGDLIPDDFVPPENPFESMSQEAIDKLMDGSNESKAELDRLRAAFSYAPVVDKLNGKRVRIAAYITPLEFNEQSLMKEFLLVPYVGACMHTPPPPANQVVHAKSLKAVKMSSMYDAVWAIGTIRTETVTSDLAESGYKLEVEQVLPYSAK